MNDLVIDESNFNEHFFDVRRHKPLRDQVIACYTANAEFIDGPEKRNVVDLLRNTEKMIATVQVMRKLLFAAELDAYQVPRRMCQDMVNGMLRKAVEKKPYKYKIEVYYYTKRENVPTDDPHWTIIEMLNLKEYVETTENGVEIRSKIIMDKQRKNQ